MKISCKKCFFFADSSDIEPGCVLVDPSPDDCEEGCWLNNLNDNENEKDI